MKKLLSLLLAALMLLSETACSDHRTQDSNGAPVQFYYEVRDAQGLDVETTVASETRYFSGFSLQELLTTYLRGPSSDTLVSPFPNGTRVLDIVEEDRKLILKMSGEFFTMLGVELSLANCCLARTICEYADVDSVVLEDEMETIHLDIYPDHYLLTNTITEESDESFIVYFSDQERRYLVAETRAATLSENETEMAYVMRQIFDGPESEQLLGIIPKGAELLGIECQDGICTLNFSHEFYENRLDNRYGAYTTIYGITNTLTSLPDIHAVAFLDEGAVIENYGIFPLDKPVARNTDAIGPVRTASGEIDVNVYVLSDDMEKVFPVPCRVKQTISQPLAEAVTTMVLGYEAFPGFYNPIPYGTELLNVSVSGNICYVDVSDTFIPKNNTEEAERAAVWALVASLTDLDNISSVVLTINGESNGLSYVDISEPLTRSSITSD